MRAHKLAQGQFISDRGLDFDQDTFTVALDPPKLMRLLLLLSELLDLIRESLSLDLTITKPLPLAALPIGCRLLRVGHQAVKTLVDLPGFPCARRLLIQVANPAKPDRFQPRSSRCGAQSVLQGTHSAHFSLIHCSLVLPMLTPSRTLVAQD